MKDDLIQPFLSLCIPAMYPPLQAPADNMFGNMPGYEGTVLGGGKRNQTNYFSQSIHVVYNSCKCMFVSPGGYLPPPMPLEPIAPPQPAPGPEDWR